MRTFISLPHKENRLPNLHERISVLILVLIPSIILYWVFTSAGNNLNEFNYNFEFEKLIPVYEWTKYIYFGSFIFVIIVPLIATSARRLREFSIYGLIAIGTITFLLFVNPFIDHPKIVFQTGVFKYIISSEKELNLFIISFPACGIIWTFLAARFYIKEFSSLKILWWSVAIIISFSCATSGLHSLPDVIFSIFIAFIILNIKNIWDKLRKITEKIANSWNEWQFGPIRIINHGIYAGAGTFLGLLIVGILLGTDYIIPILIVSLTSIIISALWAQYIEASAGLLRPFGYYGGVLGIIIGSLIVLPFGVNIWKLFGAFAIAAPLIQASGRIRCLVQGCCHGREAPENIGIKYTHPRSRVSRLTNLKDVPVYPTPLFSILWNVLVGIILFRLWTLNSSATLVAGLYLILNGLERFVEESFRGEPQTPVFGRLRLYQLIAIISIILGAVLTTVQTNSDFPVPYFSMESFFVAFGLGLLTWFAFGVDFPKSNKRF
jgi:hypothetical protein